MENEHQNQTQLFYIFNLNQLLHSLQPTSSSTITTPQRLRPSSTPFLHFQKLIQPLSNLYHHEVHSPCSLSCATQHPLSRPPSDSETKYRFGIRLNLRGSRSYGYYQHRVHCCHWKHRSLSRNFDHWLRHRE
jgi:hypothetical protein